MLIGIFSDSHCGYKYREERGNDSFAALNEAIEKTLDCDIILIAGDLFDSRVPKPEVFAKVARILNKAQNVPSKTRFIELLNKDKEEISPSTLRGVPIIAIHGTHERRSRHLVNPIQALEHAGLLIYLHCATAIFEIDGEKVAIHGMGGVPERYAKACLQEWDPKPIHDAVNILMLHQSISPYIYSPLEPPSIKLEDLPKGFDLYILGHIHWNEIKELNNGKLLICGSLIPTTVHKIESEQRKYVYKFDGSLKSIPLESQRRIIWKEFEYAPNIKTVIENFLSTIPPSQPKPIVNIRVKGKIPKERVVPSFFDLEDKFSKRFILNINKNIQVEEIKEQIELLRMLKRQSLSPEEHGLKILQENLKQVNCGIDAGEIFEHLVEGNLELLFNLLMGKQKVM
jgi:DNA repair exonuclease SbcCD nuclease subunit